LKQLFSSAGMTLSRLQICGWPWTLTTRANFMKR